jgi:hypothetical protein
MATKLQELKETARKMGAEGYAKGKKAPAQDAALLAMVFKDNTLTHHAKIALMDAWNSGWSAAHHAATPFNF